MTKRQRIFLRVIFVLTFIELVLAVLGIFFGPEESRYYIFTTLACLGMLVLLFVPVFTKKVFKILIPNSLYIVFTIFCFCAIILGDVKDFFGTYRHWDSMLHFSSGMMLAVFGFILVNTLNHTKKGHVRLSPFFFAATAFCFVMTVQSLWEICEFLCDEWFGLNAQTYMVSGSSYSKDGIMLVGHEALRDTMEDFMLDGIGSLIISVIGYINLKRGKPGFVNAELQKVDDDAGEYQPKPKKKHHTKGK